MEATSHPPALPPYAHMQTTGTFAASGLQMNPAYPAHTGLDANFNIASQYFLQHSPQTPVTWTNGHISPHTPAIAVFGTPALDTPVRDASKCDHCNRSLNNATPRVKLTNLAKYPKCWDTSSGTERLKTTTSLFDEIVANRMAKKKSSVTDADRREAILIFFEVSPFKKLFKEAAKKMCYEEHKKEALEEIQKDWTNDKLAVANLSYCLTYKHITALKHMDHHGVFAKVSAGGVSARMDHYRDMMIQEYAILRLHFICF